MSEDILRDALIAAGVDGDTIEVVKEYLRNERAYVTRDYDRLYREERAAEVAAAKVAAGTLPDYHGAITRCQIMVARSMGRATDFGRCQKPTRKVRRLSKDPNGDGRVAVCIAHARATDSYLLTRWRGETNKYRSPSPPADEVVEPEYQP